MAVTKVKLLEARIVRIVDRATGQAAQAVDRTREYELEVELKNTYKNDWQNDPEKWDDKYWYIDSSLRIVPDTDGLQFYSGPGFFHAMPRAAFSEPKLGEQESRLYKIYFKWTMPNACDVNDLKFKVGLYTHEELREKQWNTLSP